VESGTVVDVRDDIGVVALRNDQMIFPAGFFTHFGLDEGVAVASARLAMDKYGLVPCAASHPLRLSHGEKRRLNLCSVLPYDPDIVILDEPFIGQDLSSMGTMLKDIFSLKMAGKTILMVSHDLDAVFGCCDRVVLFDAGRILADDTPGRSVEKIRAAGKMNFIREGYGDADRV